MNIQARIGATGGRLKNRRHNSGGGVLLRHVCVKIAAARYAAAAAPPSVGRDYSYAIKSPFEFAIQSWRA